MEGTQIDLYEFLIESELQHYYNAIKNELKITNAAQFKYASDEDLKHIGLSRPEIRRLRKFYDKHFPHGYLSKIKRLLQAPTTIGKREDGTSTLSLNSSSEMASSTRSLNSPSKVPTNKHIIPVDAISVNKQLGTGEFGIVQQGVWTNGAERIQVAIKCLCRERMQSNPMEFLKEAAIMHSIEHENIVRLHGVVLATDSLMLVTELAHLRSLLECLKDAGLRTSFLTIPTLCEFAMQICNGMKYLENKRLIHRDLAARNILVFSKNKVKISDFGLSRALGVGKDYYKTNFNVNLKLPIAWCAPECINYLRFTNASDVWAYGVCLWEMFSYGFQPWAALMGLQILEAIDAPNYQRLEQPDCCPREYYTLMLKCWQDDPAKRPKFSEIYEVLPDIKPEQLKAIVNNTEPKKDHLLYRQGEIITVLERCSGNNLWKGVLSSGKTGYFNPSNTVAYLEGLPSSNRDSFCRVSERSSKRKLKTEMISKPQNDFKHTGHVGIDGVSFGDVAFLGSSQSYNHVPRQIVTPYKPSEDIEQTPLLLPPTPTSPDSLQTASGYFADCINPTSINPSFIPSTENTPKNLTNMGQSSFEFPEDQSQMAQLMNSTNPFVNKIGEEKYNNYGVDDKRLMHGETEAGKHSRMPADARWRSFSRSSAEDPHEYHEISDDEITADKLDFGPSLLDEINSLFGSMNAETFGQHKPADSEAAAGKSDMAEVSAKATRKNSSGETNGNKFGVSLNKKKTAGTVKQISVKDERILNQAIEIANEISARSMTDLVSDQSATVQSPKRKFSFRFAHLSNSTASEKAHHFGSPNVGAGPRDSLPFKSASPSTKKKNFTEELKNIPDIQRFGSLTENKNPNSANLRIPIFDKESSDFCFEKSREILCRPLGIESPMMLPFEAGPKVESQNQKSIAENLIDIEKTLQALNLDFVHTYSALEKTNSNETILNEQFSNIVSSLEDEISSATGSLKPRHFNFNDDFAKDKHLPYINTQVHHDQKLMDDKRSSTPDTGFASRDTNISLSRRNSQKSSYSPQDNHLNLKELNFMAGSYAGLKDDIPSFADKYGMQLGSSAACASPKKRGLIANHSTDYAGNFKANYKMEGDHSEGTNYRQRSMSFIDNYNLISPVLSEPQQRQKKRSPHVQCEQRRVDNTHSQRNSLRSRSARARTLRRLSYNPMVLSSSSSTSEESDCNQSIARSECDIRLRASTLYRRRRQGLQRKMHSVHHAEPENAAHKLYGSNASIKSAPHYNYNSHSIALNNYEYNQKLCEQYAYDDKMYNFSNAYPYASKQPLTNKAPKGCGGSGGSGSSSAASLAALLTSVAGVPKGMFQEFDVTRLTGKSPTSNFVHSSPEDRNGTHLRRVLNSGGSGLSAQQRKQEFSWPEKIPAYAVKPTDLPWTRNPPIKLDKLPADGPGAIIGEEGREAYNNLIERKTSTDHSNARDLLRYLDESGFELAAAKTLPRRSVAESSIENQQLAGAPTEQISHGLRPMTLPTRGRVKIHQQPAPQKTVLCEKHTNDINIDHNRAVEDGSPLGSPSYIAHTFQKFTEPTKESTTNKVPNAIPLPSREGKKHIKTNAKRHVRKYPLIIPANGVQRTLNKVADITNGNMNQIKLEVVSSLQAQHRNPSKPLRDKQRSAGGGDPHTYQNIEKLCEDASATDTASLKFESILEANFNESNVLQSPDVTDGFYNFSIQKEQYNKDKEVDFDANKISGLYVNEDELRNLDIEKNINVAKASKERSNGTTNDEAAAGKEKTVSYSKADNELAGNALFKKVRESINTAMTATEGGGQKDAGQTQTQTEGEYFAEVAARLKDSNSVSCEDLLEFSDKKPKGCERGVDSDEVRIMMKVLGKDSTPTRCLHTLESIDWDVHKAIKMIKLQNIFPALDYDLSHFVDVLQECEWDLHLTTLKLKGLKY